ncbi:MAG: hypothetical protein Nkreftii_000765 [Candidatus Nitrospira kreftii]|uniref:Uncharacterized protein n=1 Tax=Candidatus Nitrospira kreftii TaxID=2652173 RepID=A0A7S8FC58_9BACT|nr:MAG: hypothetical protein Nkreftii_000765 [Candidatus Nitrospira kreftii]
MTARLFIGSGVQAASSTLFSLSQLDILKRLVAAVVWHLNSFAGDLGRAPTMKVCLKAPRRTMVDPI